MATPAVGSHPYGKDCVSQDYNFSKVNFAVCLKHLILNTDQSGISFIDKMLTSFGTSDNDFLKLICEFYVYIKAKNDIQSIFSDYAFINSHIGNGYLLGKLKIAIEEDRFHDLSGDRCKEGMRLPMSFDKLCERLLTLPLPDHKFKSGYHARDTTNDEIKDILAKIEGIEPLNFIAQIADTATTTHYKLSDGKHYEIGQ
jgi:hypothetical protein